MCEQNVQQMADTEVHKNSDKQVAQLWQRDRAKLDTFSIDVQRYLQNHKITSFGHPMWGSEAIKRFI